MIFTTNYDIIITDELKNHGNWKLVWAMSATDLALINCHIIKSIKKHFFLFRDKNLSKVLPISDWEKKPIQKKRRNQFIFPIYLSFFLHHRRLKRLSTKKKKDYISKHVQIRPNTFKYVHTFACFHFGWLNGGLHTKPTFLIGIGVL